MLLTPGIELRLGKLTDVVIFTMDEPIVVFLEFFLHNISLSTDNSQEDGAAG